MVVYGNVSVYCLVWTKNIIFVYYIFYIKTIPSLLLLLTPQSKCITQKPLDKHYRSKVHFKVHLRSHTLLSPSEDHRAEGGGCGGDGEVVWEEMVEGFQGRQ